MTIQQTNSFAYYYFDIQCPLIQYSDDEKASFEPSKAKIITIQYQQLDSRTDNPINDLAILKEWESTSSERNIVRV